MTDEIAILYPDLKPLSVNMQSSVTHTSTQTCNNAVLVDQAIMHKQLTAGVSRMQ